MSALFGRLAPNSDEFKFQGIPSGFEEYEWKIDEVEFLGQDVNIDSLIAYLKLKDISFTKQDYKNHSEVHQSYIKLIGEQGWCIQGHYYMPLCIAIPWISSKTDKNKKKLEHIEKTYKDILPSTIRKFRTDFISITWYKFCRAVREAQKHAVQPTLDIDDLSEETCNIILSAALKVCKI